MMISGANALEAWQRVVFQLLQNQAELFNTIVEIDDPVFWDPTWNIDFTPSRVEASADSLVDVVNTIFPLKLAQRYPQRADFYEAFLTRHHRAMTWRRNRSRWGTYFQRLIEFGGQEVNQIEGVIQKLNSWKVRSTTALTLHLSSPETDSFRTRGGPCWHFGEFLWHGGGVIDLVVVYRNHDYFNKALGNFVGLGQLLNFVAIEGGQKPGKLICHSVHAYTEHSQRKLKKLAKLD